MSDINTELPPMISGFGDDKLFAECTKSDKNGHSLELGISEDDKIITIGGRQIAGVGGGNMVVLDGITSTWWDIARAQAEGKTVYLKFGIPGYFSSIVGPLKHALGTMDDGNKIQAIKRAWYASQYFSELNKINLAYRAPAGQVVPEEEGVEPTYQEGFVPFTYDEALQLAYGKLPLERFDLYMYGRGCDIYPGDEYNSNTEPYRTYEYPAVPKNFDPNTDATLDFSGYVSGLDDPTTRDKAQMDYDRWIKDASAGGLLSITDLTGSSRPHVIKDYTSTDEYIRHLVGYYFDEIPETIVKKYSDRMNQFNMAYRAPADTIIPITEEPVYQTNYIPFEEGDAVKLITGQLTLEKFVVYYFADPYVDEFYNPETDPTLDFSDYNLPDLSDDTVRKAVEEIYDDWVAENYEDMINDIYGQVLPAILGVLYDTLLPYEVDLDITLAGFLRVGIGLAYKRSMPFITPRYMAVGLPNTYAVDLSSFKDAGADLSTLEGVLETLGNITSGKLVDTLSGLGNGESGSGIGGILGGLIGGSQDSDSNDDTIEPLNSGSLKKGGSVRLEATRDGDISDSGDEPSGDNDDDSNDNDNANPILDFLGIDQEQLAGVVAGISEATFGRDDDIFYLFAVGMDVNRRLSTIPGLEDILGPDTDIEFDRHKGFIVDVNGWNIFAPISGDAYTGIQLDTLIEYVEQIEDVIERLGDTIPGLEYIQGLIDAIGDLLGIGISVTRIKELLQLINNTTMSFSTVLNQRAVYHLVEKGWPVSLLKFDKDAKRLYSTQCLAKVAGATPSASVINVSNFSGLIGTAIAELLIRALGNYNVEMLVELVLGITSSVSSNTFNGADDAIKDAFEKYVPLYGLEWHGLTEIPMGAGVLDGLPHDLANIHVKAGITFRTDEDEDGGVTGSGVGGVFNRTKLSVEHIDTDFLRSYVKINEGTSFNEVYKAAVLGKGVLYENVPSVSAVVDVSSTETTDGEIKSASAEQDSNDTAMRSWELHGEIVPTVYNDKKAVQMRIGAGDGSTIDLVGVENTENVPEYVPIEGDTGPESETFDNRIFEYGGNNFSVAAQVYHSEDLTPGKITSLKFHCGPGTADDYVIQVVVKEISRDFEEFPDEPISLSDFEYYFDWDNDDLIYRGVVRFLPYGTVKIPVTKINILDDDAEPEQSAVEYSGYGNLLVVIISVKYDPTIVRGELPTFFYKTDGSYTNQRCSIVGGEQIQISPDPDPNPTMTAQYGVANITFGYNEPYSVPKYELPITIGDKNSSRTDDRIFGVERNPYSVSYHVIKASDLKCAGKISSIKFYCDEGTECTREVYVYLTTLPAGVDYFPDNITLSMLASEPLVSWSDCVYYGKLNFVPKTTLDISVNTLDDNTGTMTPTTFDYNGEDNLLVVIEDGSNDAISGTAPEFYYTPSDSEDPHSSSLCVVSDSGYLDPCDPDNFADDGTLSLKDGAPTITLTFADGARYDTTASEVPDEGSGSTGHYGPLPVNSTDAVWDASPVSESHMIYPAEYIQRGGLITGIRFYYSPYWDTTEYDKRSMTRHLKAYIRYTHYTAFTSKTDSVEPPTTGNLVFDGDVLFEARFKNNDLGEKHWLTLEFDEGVSFAYDGFHSLLVSVYDYGEAEEPPTEKPPYEIFACSLMPDTKNIMSIGSKVKKDLETNENVSVPFSYNCVPLCNFVFSEDESVDPEPEPIPDTDPITPDWEANRVEGAEPVEWKIVATETRAVYVNTIEDAIKNYEWFAPQGIDVYLEYKVSEELRSASLNDDYITDINDFMPPWYPYFGGKTIRFKVVDASVKNESIFAIAESEELINSYSDPITINMQGRTSGSRAQTSSGPNLTATVKYYLVAELGLFATVLSYVPRLTMDAKNDEWYSDSLDYYRLLDPIYFYRNHFWAYSLQYTEDEFAGNYYETADLSAYFVFMALTQNMLTIDFKDDTTAYQLYENNADSPHERGVTFTSFEIARHGIERCSRAQIFLYINDDNGEVEVNNNTAALFETPYSIGLYTDEVEWPTPQAKSFAEPITETLVSTYETIPNPGEGDPTEREYYAIATEYGMDISTNSVNVLNIENYTDSDPVTIEDGNVSATFAIGDASVPNTGIPSNINEIDIYVEGDGTMSSVLPESKLYISNNKVGCFVNDGSNITIDGSTNVPISIYLEEKEIGTISTGETYILELVGPTFELRKVANGGMFLEPPELPESNSGDLQE